MSAHFMLPEIDTTGLAGTGDSAPMILSSGKMIDLMNPRAEDISLADISVALCNLCRYGGNVRRFWSVADHSVACFNYAERLGLPKKTQKAVLAHDFAEAYTGDFIRPIKTRFLTADFISAEKAINRAIAERFNVDFEGAAAWVHVIDNAVLFAEKREFFGGKAGEWKGEEFAPFLNLANIFETSEKNYRADAFEAFAASVLCR